MIDKQIKDKFRYADGTNEQDNYENFINSFDVDDEVYYRGKHYIKFINEQLKAKEQECNKLYIQLKADEEYYKEEENTLRKIIKNKEERNIELYKENNKLKQILAKIKKICNNNDELQGNFNVVDCDKYKLGKHNLANKIIQKISKCEVEND